MLKRVFFGLAISIIIFTSILLFRAINFKSELEIPQPEPITPEVYNRMVDNLSTAIQFKTISLEPGAQVDSSAFLDFKAFLEKTYPLIHQKLSLKKINDLSLLYRWSGKGHSGRSPIILAAHYDVVPAGESDGSWEFPPFSGKNAGGYIWGRGALDNKGAVIGIMEAVENLLSRGYQPERDIYIALGHDEEIGGTKGALAISNLLESMNIRPEFVLDEGLAVTRGLVPGLTNDVAMIGVSEKGFVSLRIVLKENGGHSAMPGKRTTIGIMSEAIVRLETNQMEALMIPPVKQFLKTVATESDLLTRTVFANLWLFEGLVIRQLLSDPIMASMVRTTTAPTIIRAGDKENVIPGLAEVIVNFRLLPGTTANDVIDHVSRVLNDDRFEIEKLGFYAEPSPVSSTESEAFHAIATSILEIFPDATITPNLMNAVADARHYTTIAENVYRFAPYVITEEYLSTIHGTNERIPIEGLQKIPNFYERLIINSN
ncbi:MAG: M20/M25/M40 family metallo-hydrolase [Saprospirales bacterium]|nr:MAG: M20/M25/M40 family metallo-hydrolase [Saprospirales bacterium]